MSGLHTDTSCLSIYINRILLRLALWQTQEFINVHYVDDSNLYLILKVAPLAAESVTHSLLVASCPAEAMSFCGLTFRSYSLRIFFFARLTMGLPPP